MPDDVAATGRGVVLGYNSQVVVARSDFGIPRGALTAVIGPNGSGKSTLLNALAGLIEPKAGTITVLGRPPDKVHGRVAYVLQATAVHETMPITVRETVLMGRYAAAGHFRPLGREDRQACRHSMEILDITDLAGRHLSELSGGQRQRVFVAQGLAQQAEILLLDEPLTGLDLVSVERIRAAVEVELREGTTVVTTTHDVADAGNADHVILMAGRIHAEGPPADALDPDRLSEAYGIGIVHLEDGSIVLDDARHRAARERHVHYERGGRSPRR
jgi:manganese transport system ATP-binding protein